MPASHRQEDSRRAGTFNTPVVLDMAMNWMLPAGPSPEGNGRKLVGTEYSYAPVLASWICCVIPSCYGDLCMRYASRSVGNSCCFGVMLPRPCKCSTIIRRSTNYAS